MSEEAGEPSQGTPQSKGRRRVTEPLEGKIMEPQSSSTISTKLKRIAKMARESPDKAFRSLAHYIDIEWLQEAYRRTRKGGAVGVDAQSADEYAANLEGNLRSLLERAKSGSYHAPPVRRVHIPKGDGSETRPIGIPTFEDKILQRAVAMVLEAVYEQDFLGCSYGFRARRSAHQALEDFQHQASWWRGGWVVELDIRKFFDSMDHGMLREILNRRVRDGVLLRLIGKWLNAGVLEGLELSYPDAGTPQGGVISPLLANIFLHEVLDTWFHCLVVPRLSRSARLYRYADDAVLLFDSKTDAMRAMQVLPKRFGRFGLALHPDKTRMVEFRRPDLYSLKGELGGPGTFSFLGFTHYWGKSLSGKWVVKRKTAKDRFRRALKRISNWCRSHRHDDLREQCRMLGQKLRGHYGYYGLHGNSMALKVFFFRVKETWLKWLGRRSQCDKMDWDRLDRLLRRYSLPEPKIMHPLSSFSA